MFFFEGSKCPVCSENFNSGDDVVACPVCGAPHHRACYKGNGCCAFEEQHDEGFVWHPEETDDKPAEKSGTVCPFCGADNPEGRLYCENCGRQLFADRSPYADAASGGTMPQSGSGFVSFGGQTVISDGELVGDVPVGDLKRFIGSSAFYYVPQFVMFSRNIRKIAVNFIAFITHGLWFISRKMYALGGVLLAVQLAVFAFQTYCRTELLPFMNAYMSNDYAAAAEATTQIMEERPLLMFGMVASVVIQYGTLFFSGLFANRLYMNFCLKKIKKLNDRSKTAEQFNNSLESAGGSALALAVGCGILYFGVKILIQNLFGV